mmetsp:Transcript_63594/g.196932  ORF Transcript_63594/g.196932 Transcript_63594/m.196932 type:complete len:478 (+) Transcript_63594:53-1486(+)
MQNGLMPNGSHSISGKQPFLIGIAGGTASGKTTVCQRITQALGDQSVVLLSLDEFYRDLTPEESAHIGEINFDEPAAFDIKTVSECLDALKRGESFEVPVYDFVTSKRRPDVSRHVNPADVVVIEGILSLHLPEIVGKCNMRIFVDTDDDVRLARRIRRDTVERGRDVESVLSQYTRFVKPAFEKYVLPSKQNADVIIPWMQDNTVAVNLITEHIRTKLQISDLRRIYSSLHVMPSTMQTRGMHTKIRCRMTTRTDFVFYADRLIRLVVEAALSLLPFSTTTVTTPSGELYQGVNFCEHICGVSIIRSGEAMENALRACCYGIKIGKVLIHRNGDNGQVLAYEKLPHDIAERDVLLMDPILATGNSAVRAIELLTNHRSVEESKIILLTLIAAPQGIHKVCTRFPRVKVLTTEIDECVGPDHSVRPGIGDFGDRYFGTSNNCEDKLLTLSPKPASSDEEKGFMLSPKPHCSDEESST